MAITSAALQTELGGNPKSPRVLHHLPPYSGTSQYWVIHGGQTYAGRVKKVVTTAADNAATQAAAVATAMLAGPA